MCSATCAASRRIGIETSKGSRLVTTFVFVAIRELLKVNVPQWPAGALGALLSLFVIARLRGARFPTPPIV